MRMLNDYLRETFGCKVYKIALNAGFTCPNRDGTIGTGGCIFCSAGGSGEFAEDAGQNITEQIEAGKSRVARKIRDGKYIAYFQAYTNTYAPAERLRSLYMEAVRHPDVAAVSIATRPDCLPDEVLELLSGINRIKPVWVELGLQTANDETADRINRGYYLPCFLNAVRILKQYGLPVIVHVILGLPHETLDDVMRTIRTVNAVGADGIKIHSLFIMKDTVLAEQYLAGDFTPISMQTYIDWAIEALTHLDPKIVVHRMTGNCLRDLLLAPDWIIQRDLILTTIDRRMTANGLSQGCRYQPEDCSM